MFTINGTNDGLVRQRSLRHYILAGPIPKTLFVGLSDLGSLLARPILKTLFAGLDDLGRST
jgi:hypothetical protein